MRRFIIMLALIGAVGGGAYLWIYKKKEVQDLLVPPARTAREAADKFRDAIKDRNYSKAARYCTHSYAELLKKAHTPAKELGGMVDDLDHRLREDGLITDEMKLILFGLDPFPTDINLIISNESDREATVTWTMEGVQLAGQGRPYENWNLDLALWGALYRGLPGTVRVVKEGQGDKAEWKIDFPTPPALQTATTKLVDHYKDYVNPLKVLTREVKNEPTTKENVTKRMKELLEEAARN